MKYTITEILPTQIKVEFEDSSWALVPISPELTPEQIDAAVSQYDPEFFPNPEDLINKNISVGEQRIIEKRVELDNNSNVSNISSSGLTTLPNSSVFSGYVPPVETMLLAEYFSQKGDNRLKDAITYNIERFISSYPSFDLENLIVNVKAGNLVVNNINNISSDDIVKMAEDEPSMETTTDQFNQLITEKSLEE